MPVILSQVDPRSGHASTRHPRRERQQRNPVDRRRKLVAATLEWLEARSLLATVPTPVLSTITARGGSTNVDGRQNTFDPKIAVNPLNSNHIVQVMTVRDASGTTPVFTLTALQSFDGGATWTNVRTQNLQNELLLPGATAPSPRVRYTRETYGSVAFDGNGQFYILATQSNEAYSTGTLYLYRYAAQATPPAPNTTLSPASITNVYGWNQGTLPSGATADQYPALIDASLAIDNNPATFTDGANTQTDIGAGSLYITATQNRVKPSAEPDPWNPFTIVLGRSTDGGTSFTGLPTRQLDQDGNLVGFGTAGFNRISSGNSGSNARFSSPVISISGAARTATGATVTGGTVAVAFSDFGTLATASPPLDQIFVWTGIPNGIGGVTSNGNARVVATTTVRGGATTGNFTFGANVAGQRGIGPGVSIAADSTYGANSPYQGRMYLTYVDRYDSIRFGSIASSNEADNTDIFLMYSDDGGQTWRNQATGTKLPLNQDDGTVDGHTGAADPANIANGTALRISGRPQFAPLVRVDPTTGSVVVTYLDARDDASRARYRTTVSVSIDGGLTFSEDGFLNRSQTAIDTITGGNVSLGQIPDNQSGGNSNGNAYKDIGASQGLAVLDGKIYAAWTGNLNGRFLNNTFVAQARYNSGPRIIGSTMGPVSAQTTAGGTGFNNTFASDGSRQFDGFTVTFDRPVDPTSFSTALVSIQFTPASGGAPQTIPVGSVTPVVAFTPAGKLNITQFLIRPQAPQRGVGSYSYTIQPLVRDLIRKVEPDGDLVSLGNQMDQTLTTTNAAGQANDGYSVAPPINGALDPLLLPITVGGPRLINASVPGQADTADNLALNTTVSSLDVTFDRSMNPATFTPADVLRIVGPIGLINGPTTYVAGPGYKSLGLGATIPDNSATGLTSSISIPSTGGTFQIQNLAVKLSVAHARVSDITAILVAPDGTQVPLFARIGGSGSNIVDMVLDDTSTLPLANGAAPFTNTYRPTYAPGSTTLSSLNGKAIEGVWKLVLTDSARTNVGSLVSWSLIATPKITVAPAPGQGADVRTFRISFPQQRLNGTYSVQLGSDIQSAAGDRIDANQNAGLDLLRGTPTPGGATTDVVYPSAAVPLAINPGTTITSTLNISETFPIQNAVLSLNILQQNVPDLQATLTTPYGDVILFSNVGNVGAAGTRNNFTNTVFDDAARTPIQNGAAPFVGRFNPQTSLLNVLKNNSAAGTYTLKITSSSSAVAGSLVSWALTLTKAVPGSGLGEPVADQTATSFRIFNLNPTDPVSTSTWVPVGPAGISNTGTPPTGTGGANDRASRVSGLVADPSDPSGNTVYVGGASSGIWKTTNFLTTDPLGPTYVPLTDFGPNTSLNIGSIAAFGRDGNTNRTILFAATGEGNTLTPGVGVLRSLDGGLNWDVLDSSINADANGNILPINDPRRDHVFLGTTSFKVVVDPRPTPAGETIVYIAVRGSAQAAGIWRSLDTGKTWVKMRAGQATDVILDPSSGTIDAISNPTGNLRIVWGGFQGEGVFISPNQGQLWNPTTAGIGNPLIVDAAVSPPPQIAVSAPRGTPNGAKGRVVLAKPNLTGIVSQDFQYSGWLYAAVATPDNRLDGLYMTKDFGANWVRVRLPNFTGANNASPIVPSNDTNAPTDYDPTGGNGFGQANYDLTVTVDPLNPNVVYLGGSSNGIPAGLIRVDTAIIQDSHAFYLSQTNNDGGQRFHFVDGSVPVKDPINVNGSSFFGQRIYSATDFPILNFIRDPLAPFVAASTLQTFDAARFVNTGIGANYIPWDGALDGSTDYHVAYALVDPVSGKSRMVFGNDQGVFTAVDKGNGSFLFNLGGSTPTVSLPTGSRNGNLQMNQIYSGAAQPTTGLAANLNALFYFTTQDNGFPQSDPNLLTNGNIRYSGPGGDGAGVATDQTGSGTTYHYRWPCCGGNFTDFFTVDEVGRTFGLVQTTNDPQWPFAGGINFEVNPINGDQMVIGGATGNLYGTENQGRTWFKIADRSVLDGSQVLTMAYGAPDPTAPGFTGALNNFIYAGTAGGKIFVTFTGGGSAAGNAWIDLSAGLDGSSVQKIVTRPDRGSGEAYAVTSRGVYFMADSRVPGASWQNITGNLYSITHNPYDNPNLNEVLPTSLSSIQADYRYAIPNDLSNPGGPSHPVLYIGGTAGVYRSFDNGATWLLFPDIENNGSIRAGGYMASVQITDLDMVTGVVNPTTGRANGLNAPNLLLASTYGRGAYGIRLAPIVFQSLLQVSPVNGTLPNGFQEVLTARPTITGVSQQTAFGNVTNIRLIDLSNLTDLELTDNNLIANAIATKVIGTGTTDAFGRFSINVNAGAFAFNGVKRIGVLAIDGSGTQGNLAQIVFQVNDPALGPPLPPSSQAPAAPTNLALLPADDSGTKGDNTTNVTRPRITGVTEPNILVEIVDINNNILATASAAADGTFTIRQPIDLPNGTSTIRIRGRNSTGPGAVATINITVDNTPDTPTLNLLPADDSGIAGDLVTNVARPRVTGVTTPGVIVRIFDGNGTKLGETTSDVNTGVYVFQLPTQTDGVKTFSAQAVAVLNNAEFPSKAPNPTLSIRIDLTAPVGVTLSINSADLVGLRRPNVTNLRRPRFVGTTEPNAKVQIFRTRADGSAEALNSLTAASNGSFTFQLPFELTNGTGKLYAVVTDAQGNVQNVAVNPSPVLTYSIITVAGDYNRDGTSDIANYRPTDGRTLFFSIGGNGAAADLGTIGQPGRDVPLAADFDGDGRIDVGVFRRDTAQWIINRSTLGPITIQFGQGGVDEPIPGDYDGDGRIDLAGYRPTSSTFSILMSNGGSRVIQFGQGGVDRALTGDFNGDGKTDFAVFRPTTSQFFVYTLNPAAPASGRGDTAVAVNFVGNSGFTYLAGDIPAPGDYDGLGRTELALYRPSNNRFYVLNPTTNAIRTIVMPSGYTGNVRDVPVSQDYDGDGKADPALFRPSNSTYFILGSKTNTLTTRQFGIGGVDVAIPGRYGYRLSALRAPYIPPGGSTGTSAGGAFFGASKVSNGAGTTFIPGAVQAGFGSAAPIVRGVDLLTNGTSQNPGAVGKSSAKSAAKPSRTVKLSLAPAVKNQVNKLKKQADKAEARDLALSSALESLGKLAAGRFRG